MNQDISELMQRADNLLESGELQSARELFSQVCEIDSANAEAWMMAGVVNSELGLFPDAQTQLETALNLKPDNADAHYFLANILARNNQSEAALDHCKRAVQLDESFAEAWGALGALHGELNQYEEASAAFGKAVEQAPEDAALQVALGQMLQAAGNSTGAEAAYRTAIQLQTSLREGHTLLGTLLAVENRIGEAIAIYEDALQIDPGNAVAASNLGKLHLFERKDPERAIQLFQRAIDVQPSYADAYQGLGNAYFRLGAVEEAIGSMQKAVELAPDKAAPLNNLAALQRFRGLYDAAEESFRKVLEIDPDNAEALAGQADLLQRKHQPEEALRVVRNMLDKGARTPNTAIVLANICRQFNICDEAIELIQELLSNPDLSADGRRPLHFALGKLLDQAGQATAAFEQIAAANELDDRPYDWQQQSELIDASIEIFSKGFESVIPSASNESDRPVFIVGMPRSGTSLVEQVLAAHPEVHGAGELNIVGRLAGSIGELSGTGSAYPGSVRELTQDSVNALSARYLDYIDHLDASARRVTDKMPLNFLYLGFITRLFPRARIIHCARHPLDTCLSIYFQSFGGLHPYSTRLTNIGAFYSDYARLMQHWESVLPAESMVRVQYEALVEDLEGESRKLVAFCGLDWDPRCLEFHESKRDVATASYDQVRQPLYSTSIGRWKQYQSGLEPLITELRLRGVDVS